MRQAKKLEKLEREAERASVKAEALVAEAGRLHNESNTLRINTLLEARLTPTHYRLITELKEGDIVEFILAKGFYLVGKEGRKTSLVVLEGDKLRDEQHKSLQGTGYPIESLIGYYSSYLTPETTGREDWRDSVLVNIGGPSEGRIGGLVVIPLESIKSYEVVRKEH